ncbi:MAG: alpha/beta hydrolase family protein, partial [Planctomycetota bacterium]
GQTDVFMQEALASMVQEVWPQISAVIGSAVDAIMAYIGWMVDKQLQVRGATAPTPEGGMMLLVRDNAEDDWRELVTWSAEDALNSGPVSFSGDGASIIMTDSRGANSGRLVRLDIASGETEVLAEDPTYDVVDVMMHPDTWEVQAAAICREREQWQVLDESIRDDFDKIGSMQRGDFGVTSRTHSDDAWLVAFTVDNGPVSYWAWDRSAGEGTFLFNHKPQLAEYELAEMEPVSFTSRDGLTIHGYITFPPGGGCQDLPLVLNVHGGPWARDHWGYDPEAQWLANRGYICLQVNYRGSTGYGKAFVNKGDKQWGAAMHDDLLDAVQWAVDQGFADPAKVAIYGGSYGGYAALVGATMTPEVFCCAVDIVGPSNLLTFINSIPEYWKPMIAMLHQRVGNPETEEDMLKQRSPLTHVENIRVPMLIAQGKNDPRVVEAESVQIVEAMKEKGIDHEYMLFEDEGHGFAKPENRLKFMAAAEAFLARHLGGRVEENDDE